MSATKCSAGCGDDLAWSQHPPGIAQRTQLQREAELVVNAAATPVDEDQIIVAQGPVPHQIVASVHGQGKQELSSCALVSAAARRGMADCPN